MPILKEHSIKINRSITSGTWYELLYIPSLIAKGCLMYEMLTGNKPSISDYSKVDNLEKSLHWSNAITATAKDLIIRLLSGKVKKLYFGL